MTDCIDDLIKENKLFRFQQELSQTTDETRKTMLIQIIEPLTAKKSTKKTEMNDHFQTLKELQFKKKWHALTQENKLDRIKQYCQTALLAPPTEENLVQFQKNKGLSSKQVTYDNINGKILAIDIDKLF